MRRHYPGLVHRLAAALIGGVIAALVAAPPVAQSAPVLEVASPADGATLHSLEVTAAGLSRTIRYLVELEV